MRKIWIPIAFLSLVFFGNPAARAQTDVALSVYGAFNGTTNGNGTVQSPANSAGGMVELRHISNPLVGYEGTYSYNRANQVYRSVSACAAGATPPCTTAVSANAHEVSADWIASVHIANLRPFALAGVGVLFDVPSGGQGSTDTETKPVLFMEPDSIGECSGPLGCASNIAGTCTKRRISRGSTHPPTHSRARRNP